MIAKQAASIQALIAKHCNTLTATHDNTLPTQNFAQAMIAKQAAAMQAPPKDIAKCKGLLRKHPLPKP